MNSVKEININRAAGNVKAETCMKVRDFHVWINDQHILNNINLKIEEKKITCIIGPSGGGKSTLIRSLNRINDEVADLTTEGSIEFNNSSIIDKSIDTAELRSKIGMVFQKPCVFPKSIGENVLFGIQHQKKLNKIEKLNIIEENLKTVSLWKEVSHRLKDKATSLSIGQQQRLCIARTLAMKPKVILLDEPTSALDPVSTRAIEQMMLDLKDRYTIVFVTHNIQQAERIADKLVFMCDGKVIEQGDAKTLFNNPESKETKAYLNDEFCAC